MRELRLVPPAAAVWISALTVILAGPAWALGTVGVAIACCLVARAYGQTILCGGLGACSAAVAWARCATARTSDFGETFTGTVSGAPKKLDTGNWLVNVNVDGYPAPIPVFTDGLEPLSALSLIHISEPTRRS